MLSNDSFKRGNQILKKLTTDTSETSKKARAAGSERLVLRDVHREHGGSARADRLRRRRCG